MKWGESTYTYTQTSYSHARSRFSEDDEAENVEEAEDAEEEEEDVDQDGEFQEDYPEDQENNFPDEDNVLEHRGDQDWQEQHPGRSSQRSFAPDSVPEDGDDATSHLVPPAAVPTASPVSSTPRPSQGPDVPVPRPFHLPPPPGATVLAAAMPAPVSANPTTQIGLLSIVGGAEVPLFKNGDRYHTIPPLHQPPQRRLHPPPRNLQLSLAAPADITDEERLAGITRLTNEVEAVEGQHKAAEQHLRQMITMYMAADIPQICRLGIYIYMMGNSRQGHEHKDELVAQSSRMYKTLVSCNSARARAQIQEEADPQRRAQMLKYMSDAELAVDGAQTWAARVGAIRFLKCLLDGLAPQEEDGLEHPLPQHISAFKEHAAQVSNREALKERLRQANLVAKDVYIPARAPSNAWDLPECDLRMRLHINAHGMVMRWVEQELERLAMRLQHVNKEVHRALEPHIDELARVKTEIASEGAVTTLQLARARSRKLRSIINGMDEVVHFAWNIVAQIDSAAFFKPIYLLMRSVQSWLQHRWGFQPLHDMQQVFDKAVQAQTSASSLSITPANMLSTSEKMNELYTWHPYAKTMEENLQHLPLLEFAKLREKLNSISLCDKRFFDWSVFACTQSEIELDYALLEEERRESRGKLRPEVAARWISTIESRGWFGQVEGIWAQARRPMLLEENWGKWRKLLADILDQIQAALSENPPRIPFMSVESHQGLVDSFTQERQSYAAAAGEAGPGPALVDNCLASQATRLDELQGIYKRGEEACQEKQSIEQSWTVLEQELAELQQSQEQLSPPAVSPDKIEQRRTYFQDLRGHYDQCHMSGQLDCSCIREFHSRIAEHQRWLVDSRLLTTLQRHGYSS